MSFAFSFRTILAVLLLAWGCVALSAQESSQDVTAAAPDAQRSSPLRFRRLYVPESNVVERFGEYMPMKRSEFEQLLDALSRRKELKKANRLPRLQAAEYSARLAGEQLVDGVVRWTISHEQGDPARLRLSPLRLAVERMSWSRPEGQSAMFGNTQDGGFIVDVAHSDDLVCAWSLQGRTGEHGEIAFEFAVPACLTAKMTLQLPFGWIPSANGAWVEPLANEETTDPSEKSLRRWLVVFGGRSQFTLKVAPAKEPSETRKRLWRQQDSYRFNRRGLELTSEIEIEVSEAAANRLEFDLDSSLQVADVSVADQKVKWRVAHDGEGSQRLTLDLQEASKNLVGVVRIRALAPLQLDADWELPSIRLSDGAWSEGSAVLFTPRDLSLANLRLHECRQSQVRSLPADVGGHIFEIRRLSDDSKISVRLTSLPRRMTVQSGVTFEIDEAAMSASFVADVTTEQSETFELSADAPRRWEIDSLEVLAEDALGLADILDTWEITPGRERTQMLKIRLAKSLRPGRSIRLLVQAHRRRTEARSALSAADLFHLSIHQAHNTLNLVAVDAKPPLLVRLEGGAGAQRLDPAALPVSYAELLTPASGSLLFQYGPHEGRFRLTMVKREPRFTADIRMETMLRDGRLTESYAIECSPDAPIERLLVDFTHARAAPLQWLTDKDEDALLSSRLLTSTHTPGLVHETWELTFRSPRADPFRLRALRETSTSEKVDLSLASLPESLSQTGTLAVVADLAEHWRLETNGLEPIPAQTTASDDLSMVRSEFRYRPSQQAALQAQRTETVRTLAWVWNANMASKLMPSGSANHVLTLRVENAGAAAISIILPKKARFLSAELNGQAVAVSPPPADQPILRLPLHRETRFSQIRVNFSTLLQPWRTETQIGMPQVTFDVPVLDRHWSAWLPPGYQGYVKAKTAQGGAASWARRLLGPFWKPVERPHLGIAGFASTSKELVGAARFLRHLGNLSQEKESVEQAWGALLAEAANHADSPPLRLARKSLQRQGFQAKSTVPASEFDAPLQRGLDLLLHQRLALVVAPSGLFLTTLDETRSNRDTWLPTNHASVFQQRPGHSERLHRFRHEDDRELPLDVWLRSPAGEASPWSSGGKAAVVSSVETGWRIFEIPLRPGQEPGLRVFHATQMMLIAWGCFLLFTIFSCIVLSWRFDFLSPLAGLTAVVAILTPPGYAPLSTACFLAVLVGSIACILLARPRPTPRRNQPTSLEGGSSTTMTYVGISVVLVAVFTHAFTYAESMSHCVFAQEIEPAPTKSGSVQSPRRALKKTPQGIFPVVFPVDAAGKKTGDYLRLPRQFYDLIHRAAAVATKKNSESVMTTSQYTLAFHAAGNTLEVARLAAKFEIHAAETNDDFSLPLRRDDLDLLADSVRVDGQTASFEWSADEKSLLIHGVSPGDHTLEFEFLPRMIVQKGLSMFEVHIPPVAQATLQMTYPNGRTKPTCRTALGAEVIQPEGGESAVRLGPTDRLRIEWGVATPEDEPLRGVAVEELLWLRVKPGSVVLEGQFRFSSDEGFLSRVELFADPHLKQLHLEATPAAILNENQEAGKNTYRLSFMPDEKVKEALVHASFSLARSEGVGVLRTPRIGGVAGQVTRRWLAVSIDPLLEYELDAMAMLERVTMRDFNDRWDETNDTPDFVVSLGADDHLDWGLQVKPKAVSARALQTLAISYEALQNELQYHTKLLLQISVAPNGGGFFQHRVTLPEDVKVRSVSVLENGQEHVLHWSQNAGELMIFLATKLDQPHQIVVQAEKPSSRIGKSVLPRFKIEACDVESEQVRIYRRPGVGVELLKAPGYAAVEQEKLQAFLAGSGRLAASLVKSAAGPNDAKQKQDAISLRVSLNRPRVRGRLVTVMRRQEEGWEAKIDGHVAVVGRGAIDEIRLETPNDWPENINIQPAIPFEVVVIPGRNRREIVLRPERAVDDEFTFSISSKLTVSPGEGIHSPEIQFLNVQEQKRYFAAPVQVQQQPISWRVRGLRASPLPKELSSIYPNRDEWNTYEVVAPGFSALLERVEKFVGDPMVRLVDARIAWNASAAYHGVIGFDLEPSGLSSCELVAPAGVQLVSVRIGGAAVVLEPLEPERWRVYLQSTILPQHIEVVFQGRSQRPTLRGAPWRIVAPELASIPVERTLWTLLAPLSLAERIDEESAMAGSARQNVFRLRALASLLDLPTDVAANLTESELQSWGEGFLHRVENCRTDLARRVEERESAVDQSEVATLLAGITENTNRVGLLASPFVQREHPWLGLIAGGGDRMVVRRSMHRGAENRAFLPLKESTSVDAPSVFLSLAIAWIAALSHLAWLRCKSLEVSAAPFLAIWAPALGVLLGLAWFLWLTPAWVGAFVAAGAVWGSWKQGKWNASRRLPAAKQWGYTLSTGSTATRRRS